MGIVEKTAPVSSPRGAFPLWGFFAISHGWTWLFWSVPLLSGKDAWSHPNVVFIYLGGVGPLLAGIVMTAVVRGQRGFQDLWQRLIDLRRIGGEWYGVIFLLPPLVTLLAAGIAHLFGAAGQPLDPGPLLGRLRHPASLLFFVVFIFLLGPLPEEIGWRGYALDRLQERWSALTASLVLGFAWGLWHLPLFFMENYYQNFGGEAPDPLRFFYDIILSAILITWIYNNTRRSVLAAVLFHFMLNLSGELLPVSAQVELYKTALTTAVVMVVVWCWGFERLSRHDRSPEGL